MNTGRVVLGYREAIKSILRGSAKAIIMAANTPPGMADDARYYAKLRGIPIFTYPGSSWELGAACRKPFKVSVIAIEDPGESNILALIGGAP